MASSVSQHVPVVTSGKSSTSTDQSALRPTTVPGCTVAPHLGKEIGPELLGKIEEGVKTGEFLFQKSGKRKKALLISAPFVNSTGTVLGSNRSSNSSGLPHLGGLSTAAVAALHHLEDIVTGIEGTMATTGSRDSRSPDCRPKQELWLHELPGQGGRHTMPPTYG